MYENKFHEVDLKEYSFLVTGGAGFIGSNLVKYLLKYKAKKVRVLDNLSTGFKKNLLEFQNSSNFDFMEGDIRNLEDCSKACDGMDIVFHQAALGSVPRSLKDPLTTNAVNVVGFLNMLVAAKDNGVKRFIYAASSSTYGDSIKLPKLELEIGSPLSPYAVTKYVNELYAKVFHLNYGLESIGLRYFNVFGPNQSPNGAYAAVIPLFMNGVLNNNKIFIDGDGEQTRDFTFIENAVQANIKAAFVSNPAALNQVYNVALGDQTSINKVLMIIKSFDDSSLEPEYRIARSGDIRDSLADITKIKTLLNYTPTVNIEKGLAITYEWFKSNKEFIEMT